MIEPVTVHVWQKSDRVVTLKITDDDHAAALTKIYAGIRATYILNSIIWITVVAGLIYLSGGRGTP